MNQLDAVLDMISRGIRHLIRSRPLSRAERLVKKHKPPPSMKQPAESELYNPWTGDETFTHLFSLGRIPWHFFATIIIVVWVLFTWKWSRRARPEPSRREIHTQTEGSREEDPSAEHDEQRDSASEDDPLHVVLRKSQ